MLRRRRKELLRESTRAANLKSSKISQSHKNKESVGYTGGTPIHSGKKEKLSVTEKSRDRGSKGDAVYREGHTKFS